MSQESGWHLGHFPTLDGLRGVAILMVLVGHAPFAGVPAAGDVGVTVFFTLSGFLITALLLREQVLTGRIALTAFYLRRVLRLLPALIVFLAAMTAFALLSNLSQAPSSTDLLGALFYVGNLTTAMQGRDTVITHTWSLAVEEQFYILWPVVMILVLRGRAGRRMLMAVAATGSAFAIMERLLLWDGGAGVWRVTFGADTRMDDLLVGCLAAAWLVGRRPGRNRPLMAAAALATAVGLAFTTGIGERIVVPTVVPWMTVAAILALVQQPHPTWVAHRGLRLLGERSYAVYLWHYPLWGAASAMTWPAVAPGFAVAVLVTAGVVHLSWRCVELPFLRRRSRLPLAPVSVPSRPLSRVA